MEFYDLDILHKLGQIVGTLLKIDTCMAFTTRGCYAQLCVHVPLDQSLQHHDFTGC